MDEWYIIGDTEIARFCCPDRKFFVRAAGSSFLYKQ